VLIINAVKEVRQDKNMGFLEESHIQKIFGAYQAFANQDDFAVVATLKEIAAEKYNLAINRYIRPESHDGTVNDFAGALEAWQESSSALSDSMDQLFRTIGGAR
jgi:type I restriction enzyme M protein